MKRRLRPTPPGALGSCDGQASVELVAFLPLAALLALVALCVLGAGATRTAAAAAAQAGAMAMIEGGDPTAAAREALGDRRARITVDGGTVTVELRPKLPIPALAARLTARESASAGAIGASALAPSSHRGGDAEFPRSAEAEFARRPRGAAERGNRGGGAAERGPGGDGRVGRR